MRPELRLIASENGSGQAAGAEVTGMCRTAKIDTVRSLGADHVIDYTREDITAGGHRYDVILDIGGNRPLKHLRSVLDPGGTLVIVGGETGGRWLAGSDRPRGHPVHAGRPRPGQIVTNL